MSDTATVILASDLTIAKAAEFQQQLVSEVAAAANVVLLAEAVERLGTTTATACCLERAVPSYRFNSCNILCKS